MAYSHKADARQATQESRKLRTSADRDSAGASLAQQDWQALINGRRATCYISMKDEPPTDELLDNLTRLGISVWVPIMKKGRALEWGRTNSELHVNDFGVAEPSADEQFELTSVDAIIIPAQRAGQDGTRLGRGAGYYDRALAELPLYKDGGPKRIVVVYDDEVDDSVPHDEWDQEMDFIVTPTRIINITK